MRKRKFEFFALFSLLAGALVVGGNSLPVTAQNNPVFVDITNQALGPAPFTHVGASVDLFPDAAPVAGDPARLAMLGGITLADFNGDGWNDMFVTNGKGGANALYLNNADGVPTFREVAATAGIAFPGDEAVAAVAGDVNNDGLTDLYIANVGNEMFVLVDAPNRLMLNRGNTADGVPQFEDVSVATGATGDPFTRSQQPTLVDFDNDGDLDIFVAAHHPIVLPIFRSDDARYPGKRPPTRIDLLLRNELKESGQLAFTDVTNLIRDETTGTLGQDGRQLLDSRFSYNGVWVDYDDDGDPDLFLPNDLGALTLLENQGAQGFALNQAAADVFDRDQGVGAWRSISPGDINNDGKIDVFATNIGFGTTQTLFQKKGYSLLLNNGDGSFRDVAGTVGVANPPLDGDASGDSGQGSVLFDFDNDGDLDLFVLGNWWPVGFGVSNVFDFNLGGHTNRGHLFQNRGNDANGEPILVDLMESADQRAALGIDNPFDGRGVAVGDLDNDGFQDLVILNVSGRATAGPPGDFANLGDYTGKLVVYKNTGNGHRSLSLRLVGTSSNRDGVGARVTVEAAALPTQTKEVIAGEGHYSQNAPRLVFGLGSSGSVTRIIIRWPSGILQTIPGGFELNQGAVLTITEP